MIFTYSTRGADRPAGDRQLSGELAGPESSNCVAGLTDSACGNARKAGLPLLNILATADRKTARPGDVVDWTVTSPERRHRRLPRRHPHRRTVPGASTKTHLRRVTPQATSGTVSYDEPELSWTGGDVAAGETGHHHLQRDRQGPRDPATICWTTRSGLPEAARSTRPHAPRPADAPLPPRLPIEDALTASSWRT